MAVKPVLVTATEQHAVAMAPLMKKADADEVMASDGHSPLEALLDSLERSSDAWTILVDEVPIMMAGVSVLSILGGIGCPWMLGTDEVEKHARFFLRESKKKVQEMLNTYTMLMNFVDERHVVSHRWLEWLGFTLEEPKPHGVAGLPFRKATLGGV